jgi:hypothetical protein
VARLILQQEGEWVRLLGNTNRAFVEFLKYGVKPQTYRRYDADTRSWMIYWKQLRVVAHAARRFYSEIDWATLPADWQLYMAGADVQTPVVSEPGANPFAVLCVTEDAPLEVIRAAYKALAGIYHPDHGGTEQQMSDLNAAYTEVRNLREH